MLTSIKTREAAITKGCNLPNFCGIHALGPVYYRANNSEEKLKDYCKKRLKLAEEYKLSSIVFCIISTAIFIIFIRIDLKLLCLLLLNKFPG